MLDLLQLVVMNEEMRLTLSGSSVVTNSLGYTSLSYATVTHKVPLHLIPLTSGIILSLFPLRLP